MNISKRLRLIFVGIFFVIISFNYSFALQIGGTTGGNCNNVFCDLTDDFVYYSNLLGFPDVLMQIGSELLWSVGVGLNMQGNSIFGVQDMNADYYNGYAIEQLALDTNYQTAGYGDLNNDLNYLQSGNNISELVNNVGYITSFTDTNNVTSGWQDSTGDWLIDIQTNENNIDTNQIYTNIVWADQNRGYGTMYCTDGNIVVGYLEGYSC